MIEIPTYVSIIWRWPLLISLSASFMRDTHDMATQRWKKRQIRQIYLCYFFLAGANFWHMHAARAIWCWYQCYQHWPLVLLVPFYQHFLSAPVLVEPVVPSTPMVLSAPLVLSVPVVLSAPVIQSKSGANSISGTISISISVIIYVVLSRIGKFCHLRCFVAN